MVFSLCVYALVLLLLFYGCKPVSNFSRIDGVSGDMFSVSTSKALQGFCALCVILHHISQDRAFSSSNIMGIFENIGLLFVAVFFFCSGFGLVRSLDTKPGYLDGFVRKRIVPVLTAFFVMNIIYALYRLICGSDFPVAQWVTGILGLVLLNNQAWYVIVILIMYTIFYLCFRFIKNRRLSYAIILAVILLQGALFCVLGHFAWWSEPDSWQRLLRGGGEWWQKFGMLWFQGEWWVNSTIAFFVGMLVAEHFESLVKFLQKGYWVKFAVLLALTVAAFVLAFHVTRTVSYWSEFSGKLGIGNKFICYFVQMPMVAALVLSVFTLLLRLQLGNGVLRLLGNYSLELYLMQLIPITSWGTVLLKKEYVSGENGIYFLVLYTVLVIASSLVLALAFKWLHGMVYKFTGKCASRRIG